MGNCLKKAAHEPIHAAGSIKTFPEKVKGDSGLQIVPPPLQKPFGEDGERNASISSLERPEEPGNNIATNLSVIHEDDCASNANNNINGYFAQSSSLINFSYNVLKAATHKFDSKHMIGEGGFGQVYRGWIDTYAMTAARPGEGLQVAIKKLRKDGGQGHGEWQTELDFLSQYNHPNVVKLWGYCSQGDERILVYEYMARGSLECHLMKEGSSRLTWSRRVKIAVEAAKGLAYLHNACKPVIHRDLKTSNVLLDKDFNPKLSDFGLAKFGPTEDQTHVSTRVLGTRGYLAPEYVSTGHLTLMTDVYSFGVVLLEILTGNGAVRKEKGGSVGDLAVFAKPYLRNKSDLHRIIDRRILWKFHLEEAFELADIILRCISTEAKRRPTMAEVVDALELLAQKMDYSVSSATTIVNFL